MKMKIQHTKVYGMQETTPKVEVYSNTFLSQKTGKISNQQSKLTLKEIKINKLTKKPHTNEP